MTIKSTDYALLARESYEKPVRDDKVELDGIEYKVIDSANNPVTGFQATAFRRGDTGEIVVAMRGTEKAVADFATDAGMVLNRANAQVPEALAFTKRVMDTAKGANVTVTGHSLGGTLAEVAASKFGLKGETFNAYGAAGLVGVPKGGHQVINHVRAGDPVSAASPHFGEVRVYAAQKDIHTLSKAGYRDGGGALSPRNPAKAVDFSAHGIDNFVPNGRTLGKSIIAPENEVRYRAHHGMVEAFRNDIHVARVAAKVTLGPVLGSVVGVTHGAAVAGQAVGEGLKAAGHAAGQAYDAAHDKVETGVRRASEKVEQLRDDASRFIDRATRPGAWINGQASPPSSLLSDPDHPGNGLFRQAQTGMQAIDARFGRTSNEQTDNAAGVVAVRAHGAGMTRIDVMDLSDRGEKIIAAQGTPGHAHSRVVDAATVAALNTPLAQSSQVFADAHQARQAANQSNSQQTTPNPAQQQAAPSLA